MRSIDSPKKWMIFIFFCFLTLHGQKTKFVRSFFGRIYGALICLRFYLTFSKQCSFLGQDEFKKKYDASSCLFYLYLHSNWWPSCIIEIAKSHLEGKLSNDTWESVALHRIFVQWLTECECTGAAAAKHYAVPWGQALSPTMVRVLKYCQENKKLFSSKIISGTSVYVSDLEAW